MTALRSPKDLLEAYPDGSSELDTLGMPYAVFGNEAAYTVALGKEQKIQIRCTACGLRPEAWTELEQAHHDFVSAQAHWGAARVFGIADAAVKVLVLELFGLRDDYLDFATFYFTTDDDVRRIDEIRQGEGIPDCIADARALVQLIEPRKALILDPDFKPESLARALELASIVETAIVQQDVKVAINPGGEQMRRVRDRTVARVDALQREIRHYGKYAFRKEPKIAAAFVSAYMRKKRRKGGDEPTTEPTTTTTPATTQTGGTGIGDGSSPFDKK